MAATSVTEDFIQKFHTITGTTIGERRKNLFKLLGSYKNAEIDFIQLEPKNQLEEIFKTDALIYFKKINDITQIFKTENPALLKKVIKIKWIWSYFDDNLVKQLFPKISFNAKLKIINNLAVHLKNTQQADAIFSVIKEDYGMYLAVKLLPCCSLELITENFIYNNIKHLQIGQLLFMIKKYPDLSQLLAENKSNCMIEQKCIFRELIQNHIDLFEQLYPTTVYSYHLKLGWRATNKFVQANKAAVINKAPYYYQYLNKKQVVKSIGADFMQFYINVFPKSYNDFSGNPTLYMDLLKGQHNLPNKFDVFAATFKTVYGIELFESDAINLDLFEKMNNEQRLRVAERIDIANIVWICLKKTDESIPVLQKLIALASVAKTKSELVGSLVDACRINNDYNALVGVLKYVYQQHYKDSSVLLCFLRTLENGICLNKLNEQHWFYLGKLLKSAVALDTHYFYFGKCLYSYAYFLFRRGEPLKPIVRIFAKKSIILSNLIGYNPNFKIDAKFEKQYLIILAEVLPEVFKDKELKSRYIDYLYSVTRWNKKHHNDSLQLLVNTEAKTYLQDDCVSENPNYLYGEIMSDILSCKHTPEKSFWAVMYFKKSVNVHMDVVEHLIKYEPLLVCDHIEPIMNSILELYYTQVHRFFFTLARNYTHLELPQKIANICTRIITSPDESESRKKNALTGLSYVVADPENFISILTPYYPVDKTEPDATTYVMQQNMSRSLGNVVPSSSMLKSVLLFSKGDYTKFIRRSMYVIAFSVTEDKLVEFFTALNNLAVSVRKHAVYLSFRVLNRQSIYNNVRRNSSDKNVSIRKFLMRCIFNFFIKNPDDFLWDMLKNSIKNVDTEDKEALDILVQLNKVPVPYMGCYIEFIAEFITFDDKIADLIPNSVYATLSGNFIMSVIDLKKYGNVFIYKYLFNSINNSNSDFQLAILEKVVTQQKESSANPAKFLQECYQYWIQYKCRSVPLFRKCAQVLNGLQPHEKYLNENLYLQLYVMYVEHRLNQDSVLKFAQALVHFTDDFITKYKPTTFHRYTKVVNTFIWSHFSEDDFYVLIQNIIENNSSEHCISLVIALLPRAIPTAPKLKLRLNHIIEILKVNQNPVVSMVLSLYLNEIMPQYGIVEERSKFENSNAGIYYFDPYNESAYTKALLVFE